jgi:hypothetical protein
VGGQTVSGNYFSLLGINAVLDARSLRRMTWRRVGVGRMGW